MAETIDSTYGKSFTCARCRAKVDCIFHDDPEPVLTSLGWHKVGDLRMCSRMCLDWYRMLAERSGPEVKPVNELGDRAYQNRRRLLDPLMKAAAPKAKP